jgi:hypothetical protein
VLPRRLEDVLARTPAVRRRVGPVLGGDRRRDREQAGRVDRAFEVERGDLGFVEGGQALSSVPGEQLDLEPVDTYGLPALAQFRLFVPLPEGLAATERFELGFRLSERFSGLPEVLVRL